MSVTGFANVGLQLFLPLGPKLALFGFDLSAYQVETDTRGIVQLYDDAQVALINDLQWEAAQAALFSSASTSEHVLMASALKWSKLRKRERTFLREEVVAQSGNEVRTRHGSGAAPSTIKLDLSFVHRILPRPKTLTAWEVPPFRDAERIAQVDRAFARLDMLNESGEQ